MGNGRRDASARGGALRSGMVATGVAMAMAAGSLSIAECATERLHIWPSNEAGLTYCPIGEKAVGARPDLEAVIINAGMPDERVAYVYAAELDAALGGDVSTPEEAAAPMAGWDARAADAYHDALDAELGARAAAGRDDAAELRRRLTSVVAPEEDATALVQQLAPELSEKEARALLDRVRARVRERAETRLAAYELDGSTVAGTYVVRGF